MGVEKGVINYSCRLGRNLKEFAVKTLTFCYIEGGVTLDKLATISNCKLSKVKEI